jgi:hypothetical protein
MLQILRFFFSSKRRLFHNATFFGSCIIHILHTGCAKIKKKIRRQRVKECSARTTNRICRALKMTAGFPPKHCYLLTKVRGVMHQKTEMLKHQGRVG